MHYTCRGRAVNIANTIKCFLKNHEFRHINIIYNLNKKQFNTNTTNYNNYSHSKLSN